MKVLICLTLAIAWGASSTASAATDSHGVIGFTGHWAAKAEGRVLLILTLEGDAGARTLSGKIQRPAHMSLSPGSVSSVSLPLAEERVIRAHAGDSGVRLQFQDAQGNITHWLMELSGAQAATLRLLSAPPGAVTFVLHLCRVSKGASVAADWDATRSYVLDQPGTIWTDNPNMTRMFENDQAEREAASPINLKALARADAHRRRAVTAMLHRGELHTGLDYLHAAFIFQHGDQPHDFLLAHALALSALAKGQTDAGWIAAATLDRYLQSENRPQIYGTQFRDGRQDPFDEDLIPDTLRLVLGVPGIADQRVPSRVSSEELGPNCRPVDGEAALWRDRKTRFVVIGETHGTTEEPALFGDLVCAAYNSGRPVVAALEAAQDQQSAIDAFLSSDGGLSAVKLFLRAPFWQVKDGRSSSAYLDLFERLRLLRSSGRLARVAAIQPTEFLREHRAVSDNEYNAAMAGLIKNAGAGHHHPLVLVLVGDVHASRDPVVIGARTITPAAFHLPPAQTMTLRFVTGGEAWDCRGADCGVHVLSGAPPAAREIRLGAGPPGFDGAIDLGTRATAALPLRANRLGTGRASDRVGRMAERAGSRQRPIRDL
jgi:hypothetical protein